MTQQEKKIICDIQKGDLRSSYDLLETNRSFLFGLFKKLQISGYYFDEFISASYVALIKAARGAQESKLDFFLGYWKKYIMHEILLEKLRIQYKFSISINDYCRSKKDNVDLIEKFYADTKIENFYVERYESFYNAELRKFLWSEINKCLTTENAYILWEIYYENRTLVSLAKELNIGAERVRKRKVNSLQKLAVNPTIKKIAEDFFGY